MSGAVAVAIQKGNVQALDHVHLQNRMAGLVKSRSRSQPSSSEESSSPSVSINISTRRVADARDQFGDDSEELSPLPDVFAPEVLVSSFLALC